MEQLSILSAHKSCCNLLNEESTKKLQAFYTKIYWLISTKMQQFTSQMNTYKHLNVLIMAVPHKLNQTKNIMLNFNSIAELRYFSRTLTAISTSTVLLT